MLCVKAYRAILPASFWGSVVRLERRGFLYSSKKGISRDFVAKLHQPLDFSIEGLRRWAQNRERTRMLKEQAFNPERLLTLGPDLAAAHFVVSQNGAVKFRDVSDWICCDDSGNYSLPSAGKTDMQVEAIDLSATNVMFCGFDNFVNLNGLKYLNLSRCPNVDDWCMDKLSMVRNSLLVLDVTDCSQVSERGLACLHKLRNLRRLIVGRMPCAANAALFSELLQESLPHCVIQTSGDSADGAVSKSDNSFLERYRMHAAVLDVDKEHIVKIRQE